MAANHDEAEEEAAAASINIDVEDGLHVQSKFISPEEPVSEEQAPPSPFSAAPTPTSNSRLYLMVLADFGLAFTWLAKFAVAT